MKTSPILSKHAGLTLIELLVVVAVIVILAAMLLPATSHKQRPTAATCMSNQRQIAIALIMFQGDHDGKYPWQVSTTNNGSIEPFPSELASSMFSPLAPYFGNRPQPLKCPADKTRQTAINFSSLSNTNISYFLNLDAATNMSSVLTGDRNLEIDGNLIHAGIFVQTTNTLLKWSEGFHGSQNRPYGMIAFADGHAERIQQERLHQTLQGQPLATNRFCFP